MSFFRPIVLTATLLLAGTVHATDVSMAGGSVSYHTPDNWLGIMETQGDPEARVFQVPDPSPTGSSSLARVTVTVKQVEDIGSFQQDVNAATTKAKAISGYKATGGNPQLSSYAYTAQENGAPFSYSERYWFKNNHAIQLRCVRPSQSQAGAAWTSAFDKGCDTLAAQLK